MKKLFTLACAAAVTAGAMAAAPVYTDLSGITKELKQDSKLFLQQEMINFDKGMSTTGKMLAKRAWEKDGSLWTVEVTNVGGVWDLYTFTNEKGEEVKLTQEECPYYLVTMLIKKYGASEGTTQQMMSVTTQWNLWWPCNYYHTQFVDAWAENTEIEADDLDIATFDSMCNMHENELFPEYTYCSLFRENETQYLPTGEFDIEQREDNKWYYLSPTAKYWRMEFGGCILDGTYYKDSGKTAGLYSEIDWTSYNPTDNWTTFSSRMFLNGTNRFSIDFDSDMRVQGWDQKNLAYPEIKEIHIFNRGIQSSALAGDTDLYGVAWGPLQVYEVWGVGRYIDLYISEAGADGPYDANAIGVKFSEDYDGQVGFTDAQNFFYGGLFCAEGDDLANGGKWNMLEPYKIPGTSAWTVKPVAGSLIPRAIFDKPNEDYLIVVNQSFQDLPNYEGTFINTGTKEGFILNYNNGSNMYAGYYKGDIIFHYDANDMSKTKMLPAVGSLEPDPTLVSELEAADEAPVYFNLQGVRVANPENGLYIKVAGNKTSKVIL